MTEPVILHRCPHCGRIFDSPSVCTESGQETEPFPATATKEAFVDDRAWPYGKTDTRHHERRLAGRRRNPWFRFWFWWESRKLRSS